MNIHLPQAVLDLSHMAEIVTLAEGTILKKQFERVEYFFLLLEGTVHFHQIIEDQKEGILAGKSHSPYTPVGMDAFIHPYRNETSAVIASSSAKLVKWKTQSLISELDSHPKLATNFFKFINHHSNRFISDTSGLFSSSPATLPALENKPSTDGFLTNNTDTQTDLILFLLQSPFFEVFEENYLELLTQQMERRQYQKGDQFINQGEVKKGIFILESGAVQYTRNIFNIEEGKEFNIPFRSISTPGYLISSSSLLGVESAMIAIATQDTVIRYIPWETLISAFDTHLTFELQFQKRVLWLINNQLRAVRTRCITSQFEDEEIVATTLITGSNTKISIASDLHKVPSLLANKKTIPDALAILHDIELKGLHAERNLASLCLDNLPKTQKESAFYQALVSIYSTVAENDNKSLEEIQMDGMVACKKAFNIPSIYVKGLENMPAHSGCIFIYNHLLNHDYYTLPNQFQITLDSHYLGYLLYEMYGQQATRVVRIGKREEFAHDNYYSKFDFINVITQDSDESDQSASKKLLARENFNNEIRKVLAQGKNIIISPEGVSNATEMSPTVFRSGIFKLIQGLDFEPLIVPIIMANFDKRITDKKLACEIKKPFKLSEKLKQYKAPDIGTFLTLYRTEYRKNVAQLAKSTSTENSTQLQFEQEVKELRSRVSPLKKENGLMAFYGSSTLRLWDTLQEDLESKEAINFAFGGSTYEWCLRYFDQIFEGIHPSSYVLYAGDNDLANGLDINAILGSVQKLIKKIKYHTPAASIAIISIKPSPSREYLRTTIIDINQKLKLLVEKNDQLHWIETYKYMLNKEGKSRTELFIEDMLHLNKKGYECWSRAVKDQLQAFNLL